MTYETLLVTSDAGRWNVTFNRPERRNSFNLRLLEEMERVLDEVERDATCRLLVLEGRDGHFCRGLDFADSLAPDGQAGAAPASAAGFMRILKRLSLAAPMVVANVDGEAMAGGVAFVAVADLALATPRSHFSLPEALWGLVPACVGLYVARRIGLQRARRLCLTTETLTAEQALAWQLVDEVGERPQESLRRLALRLARVQPRTLGRVKRYFRDVGAIDEARERRAVEETDSGARDPLVRAAIADFVQHGRFPWDTGAGA